MPDAWMPGIERAPTAAYSAHLTLTPIGICSHIMEGRQSTMLVWAKERPPVNKVSAHFTIGRNGKVYQHVPIDRWSWCQGRLDPGHPPTWPDYRAGVNPNSQLVSIEHEGVPAQKWTAKMLAASIRVQKWVCREWGITPSLDTIIGHRVIAPVSRADDPGPHWPQQEIIDDLRKALGIKDAPAPVTPSADGAHHEQHAAIKDALAKHDARLDQHSDIHQHQATAREELAKRVRALEERLEDAGEALSGARVS